MEVIDSGKKYEFGSQLKYDTVVMLVANQDTRICHTDFVKDKEVRVTELLARAILDSPKAKDRFGEMIVKRIGHIGKVGVGEDRVFKDIYYDKDVKSDKIEALSKKLEEMESKLNRPAEPVVPEEEQIDIARSPKARAKKEE